MHNQKDTRLFASNGQQRAISLALKLAEVDVIQKETGHNPVMLLDDVLLEMDDDNTQEILDQALQCDQIILTTTNLDRLPDTVVREATIVRVEDGVFRKE